MKNNTSITKTKENQEMRKYIVEAPAPKKGQSVSSGGIRENGKLAVQYKNPVPYTEPNASLPARKEPSSSENHFKREAKEIGMWLMKTAWNKYGKPVVEAKFEQWGQQAVSKITSSTRGMDEISPESIIDADYIEVDPMELANEKIICFPQKRVG